ncbi:MAG: antitoxin family protein [Pyrinomonadaceae bacterium]|nr:antitoxin family protein [Pyrinomonadaceae bacterium]
MSQTISAVYENGTLILSEPLAVSNGVKVEIIVVPPRNQAQEKTPAEILTELAALPIEGKTDKFSGRDHDKILYGENGAR